MFSMPMSVCQQSVLKVTSSIIVARSGAFGWHDISLKITLKRCFHFTQFIISAYY